MCQLGPRAPQTLLQLLRSGRGDGYRAALSASATDEVIACVLDDPRWDRQVESRDAYYANLLIALNADVQPLVDRIASAGDAADESALGLPIGVLAQMARRQHAAAASGLARCIDVVEAASEPTELERIRTWKAHLSSASVPELLRAANRPGPIRPIVDELLRLDARATDQALRSAARDGSPRQRAVALQVLGTQGCVDYLDDAKQFLAEQTEESTKSDDVILRISFVRYLVALDPELTLPLARDWLSTRWPLSHAAEEIFSRRATPADRRALEVVGEAALAAGEMYRLCSMLEGLARIGDESLPLRIQAYAQAPYSLARSRALVALRPHAQSDAVAEILIEALWDCQSEARAIACAAAPLTDSLAARRLIELGADVFEETNVRRAAAARDIRGSE